jgi:ketosteroid isomerase-like protein
MSHENVEVVKAANRAWNAGGMDAFRELHDPDAILRPEKDWPEPGPYVGREAVMRFYEQLRETWDADTVELSDDIDHAADRVVARFFWHPVGGHGPDPNLQATIVQSVRNGRIREVEFFWDHDEALEAAGLRE